jgi:hypothetical protein
MGRSPGDKSEHRLSVGNPNNYQTVRAQPPNEVLKGLLRASYMFQHEARIDEVELAILDGIGVADVSEYDYIEVLDYFRPVL